MIDVEDRRNAYTGNGSGSNYDYDFKINSKDDLVVKVVDTATSPTEYTLVRGTDYTVNGAGNSDGGSIDLIDDSQAWINGSGKLTNGYYLTIIGDADYLQGTDLANQGSNYQESQEALADKIVILIQQLREIINRSPNFSQNINLDNFSMLLPLGIVGQADKALVTNSSGNGWDIGPSITDIANALANATAAAASATAAEAAQTAAETAQAAAEAAAAGAWSAWTDAQTITAGGGATALTEQGTWLSATYQSVVYEFQCHRGSPIDTFATGRVAFHRTATNTWVVAPGMIEGDDPGLTWTLSGTTTQTLSVDADAGDDAEVRVSRRFVQ